MKVIRSEHPDYKADDYLYIWDVREHISLDVLDNISTIVMLTRRSFRRLHRLHGDPTAHDEARVEQGDSMVCVARCAGYAGADGVHGLERVFACQEGARRSELVEEL